MIIGTVITFNSHMLAKPYQAKWIKNLTHFLQIVFVVLICKAVLYKFMLGRVHNARVLEEMAIQDSVQETPTLRIKTSGSYLPVVAPTSTIAELSWTGGSISANKLRNWLKRGEFFIYFYVKEGDAFYYLFSKERTILIKKIGAGLGQSWEKTCQQIISKVQNDFSDGLVKQLSFDDVLGLIENNQYIADTL